MYWVKGLQSSQYGVKIASGRTLRHSLAPETHGEIKTVGSDRRKFKVLLNVLGGAAMATTVGAFSSLASEQGTTIEYAGAESLFEPLSEEVRKSQGDDREYKAVTLSNGLRVLLIQDPTANLAAAAMDVHVGSTSDPENIQGLAHFCEHMSFLGTKKYPKEAEFSEFLSSHGGSTNAYTDQEDTVYYFDINSDFLNDGLDRFSQFFISPTFSQDGTDRELNAIESEHSKNINDDGFRLFQLEKDVSDRRHPYHKFSTGNKETLERIPKSKGIDVREELLKFHGRYYSANQMTLCVCGKDSITKLEKWVTHHFRDVPNKSTPPPEMEWWGKVAPYPYATPSGSKFTPDLSPESIFTCGPVTPPPLLEVVPAGQARRLTLQWPIWVKTPARKEFLMHAKPEAIVSHLIGHEGKGSLRSFLAQSGWLNDLRSSIGSELSDFMQFEVSIDLTEQGFAHLNEVVEAVYAYINLLKGVKNKGTGGIPEYVYKEVQQLSSIGFDFAEKSDPSDYVSMLAADMQVYKNPAEYLTGNQLFTVAPRVTEREVQDFLEALTPNSGKLTVISKDFEGKTKEVQQWYGTKFNRKGLSVAQLEQWTQASPDNPKYSALALPEPNQLIPSDFTLLGGQGSIAEVKKKKRSIQEKRRQLDKPPRRILMEEADRWEVWHKLDYSFQQPRTYAIFSLAIDKESYDSLFVINSRLFSMCFMDSVNEYLYEARLAGLNFNLEFTSRGLVLTFTGFSEKLPLFTEKMLQFLKDFKPNKETYARFRDVQKRELDGWKTQQPYYHANYYASQVLETLQYDIPSLKMALENANMDMLTGFLEKSVGRTSFGTALFAGNVDEAGSGKMVRLVDSKFNFLPLQEERRSRRETLELPVTTSSAAVGSSAAKPAGLELNKVGPNSNEENSASAFYFQVNTRDVRQTVMAELLADVVEQPFYDSLRTKQQLGYIVYAGCKIKEGIPTLLFVVQSSLLGGQALSERVADFLYSPDQLPALLAALSEESFAAFKQGIRSKKLEPDQRLTAQAGRFWGEIGLQRPGEEPVFDRNGREVEALKSIKKDDFLAFAQEVLNGGKTRLLVSEITSSIVRGNIEQKEKEKGQEELVTLVQVEDTFSLAEKLNKL